MTDNNRFDDIDASIRTNFRREAEIIADYELNDDSFELDLREVETAREAIADYDSQFPGSAQEFERLVEQLKTERVKQRSEAPPSVNDGSTPDKSDEAEQSDQAVTPSDDGIEANATEAWIRHHFLWTCEQLADYEIRVQAGEELSDDEKRHWEELKESVQEFVRRFPEDATFLQELLEDARRWIQEERSARTIQEGSVFPSRGTYQGYGSAIRNHSRPAGWDTGQRPPVDLEAHWAEKNRKKQQESGTVSKGWQEPGIPKTSLFNDHLTSDWASTTLSDTKEGMTEKEATQHEYNAFQTFLQESSAASSQSASSKPSPNDTHPRDQESHHTDEVSDYLSMDFSDMLPDPSQPFFRPVDEPNDEDGYPFRQ